MNETPTLTSIAAPVQAEIEVKRSRFLARLAPACDEASARAVVEASRKEHWDARHHCSAFVLGVEGHVGRSGDTGVVHRSSDDGEPAGTAGAPILEVLTGRGLTDVVAVVTRWFGGTKLGTGGLIRAYGDAVREACGHARPVTYRLLQRLDVDVAAGDGGLLLHQGRELGGLVRTHRSRCRCLRHGRQRCLDRVRQVASLGACTGHDLRIAFDHGVEVVDQGLQLGRELPVEAL